MVDNIPLHPSSAAAETIESGFKRWTSIALVGVVAFLAAWSAYSYILNQRNRELGDAWKSFSKFEESSFQASSVVPPVESIPENLRPWANLAIANKPLARLERSKFDEAKPLFEKLVQGGSKSGATVGLIPEVLGPKQVVASIDAFAAWENANPQLLQNPEPEPTEKARIVTELGTIEIGFYSNMAPEHVKNFRQLIRDHFYEKTKFHRVTKAGLFIVQGGDPNTIEGTPDKWGQGTKGDGIPVENNKLAHVRGAVAMAQPSMSGPGGKKSSGCQFYIVTQGSHTLDGNYTVFGKVISGMDVVDKIASGEIEANTMDRPKVPVMVTKTEIF